MTQASGPIRYPPKRALSQASCVIALTLVNGTVLEDELVDEL